MTVRAFDFKLLPVSDDILVIEYNSQLTEDIFGKELGRYTSFCGSLSMTYIV